MTLVADDDGVSTRLSSDMGGKTESEDGVTGPLVIPCHFTCSWCTTVFFRKIASVSLAGGLVMASAVSVSAQQARPVAKPASPRGVKASQVRWQPVRPARALQETATEELPTPPGAKAAVPVPDATTDLGPQVYRSPGQVMSVPSGTVMSGPSGPMVSGPYAEGMPPIIHEGEVIEGDGMPGEPIFSGPVTYGPMMTGPMDGQILFEGEPVFDGGSYPGEEVYGGPEFGGEAMADGSCDGMGGACKAGCRNCRGRSWRPCLTICLPEDGWVNFDYLGWFPLSTTLPPLVTTSVGSGVSANDAGVLGRPATRILYGGQDVLDDSPSGGRLQVGLWLDPCHRWSLVGDYFELNSQSDSFNATSDGSSILARPFFNVLIGAEDAQLIGYPQLANGEISIDVESSLVGGGFSIRRQTNSFSGKGWTLVGDHRQPVVSRADFLMGYRYLQLDESIMINEKLNELAAPRARYEITDSFEAINQFNGWDLGFTYRRDRGAWSLDILGKMALGVTHQEIEIAGTTAVNGVASGGGVLAQTSNIGTHSRDTFTVLPELGMNLGYGLTDHLRVKAGYTLIFWSNVLRPADQIDLDVNPNLFPPAIPGGAARPDFVFRDSDFWVQGMNFGGEFTW